MAAHTLLIDCSLAAGRGWTIYSDAPNPLPSPMLELTVPPEAAGRRLDHFLTGALSHLSRSRVQALIRGGHVRLNRRPISKPAESLRPADIVGWEEPPVAETTLAAEAVELSVLHEDDDLLVIDKAAGMVTHPAPGHGTGTLVNALLAHCTTLSGVGGERRPGIVHRLDKETSGCLVVAKNDFAHRALAAQFAGRTTEKHYLALVRGVPTPASGTVDAPIGRHPVHRKKMAVVQPPRGRTARTDYCVRRAFVLQKTVVQESEVTARPYVPAAMPLTSQPVAGTGTAALVECRLHTGRTHQIRVHLKQLGHPILGDALYGGPRPPARQMLHAWTLAFTHPRTGQRIECRAPLPADFLAFGIDPHDP